jgi:hypothetical protein
MTNYTYKNNGEILQLNRYVENLNDRNHNLLWLRLEGLSVFELIVALQIYDVHKIISNVSSNIVWI